MTYLELFDRVVRHLRHLEVDVQFERGPAITGRQIREAHSRLAFAIPQSVVEFYTEVGNGLSLYWEAEGGGPRGSHEFPSIEAMVAEVSKRRDRMEWNDAGLIQLSSEKRRIRLRMRRWLAIDHHGNGARFCVDAGSDLAPVVYSPVSWMDGPNSGAGFELGATLSDFHRHWSRVCFQSPSSWPSAFDPSRGTVRWEGPEFQDPYRLAD